MNDKTKRVLFSLLIIYGCSQLIHTFLNKNSWPICSYNMFSTQMPEIDEEYMIELTEDDGSKQMVKPGNCFPIEYYRLNGMIWETLNVLYAKDKEKFFKGLITRLNTDPWKGFDEILPAAKPKSGKKFVKMKVFTFRYDLKKYKVGTPLIPFEKITEYSISL